MIDPRRNVPFQFDRVASACGSRIAIGGGRWAPTFQELDEVSNRMAAAILDRLGDAAPRLEQDARVGERIALLMSYDAPVLAVMLAVLKAGKAYVALNPGEPSARLAAVVEDAAPALIVAEPALAESARRIAPKKPLIVVSPADWPAGRSPLPAADAKWNDVACLVHTSGSTGRPKGVMRTHGQILDCARRVGGPLAQNDGERVIGLASLNTGQGQTTVWTALLRGATFYPFPAAERGVTGLADFIAEHRIRVYTSSVSLFRCFVGTLAGNRLPSVRVVRFASEPATLADFHAFQRHFPDDCRLVNALSSTETGAIAHWIYDPSDPESDPPPAQGASGDRLPLGRPVEGIDLDLVDERGRPAADGEPGEVVVRSPFLSAGYWRDPESTARRFSFDRSTGVATFRGGDLMTRRPDGTLAFAGRRDARLKIRGWRIEPGEVEAAIQARAGVASAVVGAAEGPAAEPLLVAYFTADDRFDGDPRSLRDELRARLPDSMIPSRFIRLDEFPLTSGGKVDRRELFSRPLPADESADGPAGQQVEPSGDHERMLAAIWGRVFRRERIGRCDHFFELGGDSLLAAVVAANVHAESGVELPLRLFNDHPTLESLAAALARLGEPGAVGPSEPPAPKISRDGPLPVSFAQEWIYRECSDPSTPNAWTTVQKHQISGDVDVELLRRCFRDLVARHEILRTTYALHEGRPAATVHDATDPDWTYLDYSRQREPVRAADAFVMDRLQAAPFALDRLPLARFWLVRIREKELLLYRAVHHIVVDAWSWKIFFDELTQLYQARRDGGPDPLPEAPQYVDYAARQRRSMEVDSPRYRRSVDWWESRFQDPPEPLRLPFARRRPRPDARPEDGMYEFPVEIDVSARLDRLAVRANASRFAVRFAVLAAALAEAAGGRELVVGAYATGRTSLELQAMFGMFANLMTLRLRWDPSETFAGWVRSVSVAIAEAREHSDIPYQLLREELEKRNCPVPAIEAIIAPTYRFAPAPSRGLRIAPPQRLANSMPWGFTLSVVQEAEDRWRCRFDARRYDPRLVRRFLRRCRRCFRLLSSRPDRPLAEVLRLRPPQSDALPPPARSSFRWSAAATVVRADLHRLTRIFRRPRPPAAA